MDALRRSAQGDRSRTTPRKSSSRTKRSSARRKVKKAS
jgi:hypothetical protein